MLHVSHDVDEAVIQVLCGFVDMGSVGDQCGDEVGVVVGIRQGPEGEPVVALRTETRGEGISLDLIAFRDQPVDDSKGIGRISWCGQAKA